MSEQILKELDENLCSDWNEHDSSVGIYQVQYIDKDLVEDLEEREGVKVISHTKDNAILEVDGIKVEVYPEIDGDEGFKWKVREYKPS